MVGRVNRSLASKAAVLGLAALGVAACSSTEDARPRPCPEIRIPADAAKLTRFKPGPGRAIIDILHQEQIIGFGHVCAYDTDETGTGEVTVQVAPTILSERGPADTAKQADFEYFVALVDSQKRVVAKQRFALTIPFPNNLTRVQWQREQAHVLHVPLATGQSGADYTIFIGLQMTREEMEYTREKR